MAENEEQDEKDKPEPLEGEEALALARQGKNAWNAWAEDNPGREVDFVGVDFTAEGNKDISFEGFTFPGEADFSEANFQYARFDRATFKGNAWFGKATFEGRAGFGGATFERDAEFIGATFKGDTWFDEATFEESAWFDEATFEEGAVFSRATFEGSARFEEATFEGAAGFYRATFEGDAGFGGATFTGPVILYGSRFRIVPDFRRSEFQKHATLHGIEVDFRRPTKPDDADRYRRLKELAFNARDHDREQMFFAYELIAKRGHETRGLALIPNYLYEWTSDFGRSLALPSIGLFFNLVRLRYSLSMVRAQEHG